MPSLQPIQKKVALISPTNSVVSSDRRPNVLARLVSLGSTFSGVARYLATQGAEEAISSSVIYFPSMPEVLELSRKAEYRQSTAPYTPDGIHLYKHTLPLEIPITFSLHSQDYFCKRGGVSLLAMAAKLHALLVPINNSPDRSRVSVTVGNYYANVSPGQSSPGKAPALEKDASTNGTPQSMVEPTVAFNGSLGQATTVFPTACLLDLISVGDRSGTLGVRCYGYVSSVVVKLRGPWLSGEVLYGPDCVRNLPTSAEFSFTFVHAPGFSNYFAGVATAPFQLSGLSAFAKDIVDNLYNTAPLTEGQSVVNRYIGYGENPNSINSNLIEQSKITN